MVSKSDTVRQEILKVTEKIADAINGDLIPFVFAEIDKRCISLDAYTSSILPYTPFITPESRSDVSRVKREEIGDEISTLEKYADFAFSIVGDISQSKEILGADTTSRQLLNIYLFLGQSVI